MHTKTLFVGLLAGAMLFSCNKGTENAAKDVKEVSEIGNCSAADLPKEAKYEGEFEAGKKWKDKNGENFFVLTGTKVSTKKVEDMDQLSRYIYGYHFVKEASGAVKEVRKINDYIVDCPFDLKCDHDLEVFQITDLDKDAYAEITMLYYLSCKSDISPDHMKLMMLENGDKFPIRGSQGLVMGEETIEPQITWGDEFKNAPKEFKEHAQKILDKKATVAM